MNKSQNYIQNIIQFDIYFTVFDNLHNYKIYKELIYLLMSFNYQFGS